MLRQGFIGKSLSAMLSIKSLTCFEKNLVFLYTYAPNSNLQKGNVVETSIIASPRDDAMRANSQFGCNFSAIAVHRDKETQLHKSSNRHRDYDDDQEHRVEFGKHRTPRSESFKLIRFSICGLAPFKTALQLFGAHHQRR